MANEEHVKKLLAGVAAWNAWREKRPGERPDLREAKLAGVDLRGADLRGVDLSKGELTGANLTKVGLIEANLGNAIFTEAILEEAELTKVELVEANLSGARLSRADFRGARLYATVMGDLDLCEPLGLETTSHYGPSIVGADTLARTAASLSKDRSRQGAIEQFLRAAGLEENYLEFFRSTIGRPIEFYSCFISYTHMDKSFARRLYDHLQSCGIRCWLDEHQLLPGDKILTEIDRGIRLWDKVLLCCSQASLNGSWWVDKEIDKALRKEEQLFKERGKDVLALIPLNLDGYLLKGWESPKASLITDRLAANFTGWETNNAKFEAEFKKVVQALRADEGAREKPPKPRL